MYLYRRLRMDYHKKGIIEKMRTGKSFSFGANWERFIKSNFSPERVKITLEYLLTFLGLDNLEGKYFLDIGCGSGLHSLAAYEAKAKRLVSIDVDPLSIKTTMLLRDFKGNPGNWQILEASILDEQMITKIDAADIVYSWGVLHHTGNLWKAIQNASRLIKKGGLFYIAVYEKNQYSQYWIDQKKKYNRSSNFKKRIMEIKYVWESYFKTFNPRRFFGSFLVILRYKKSRGMEFWTDVRDWLGGWPYEPATLEEVCRFCEETLGLRKIKVKPGKANIEYLFERPKE